MHLAWVAPAGDPARRARRARHGAAVRARRRRDGQRRPGLGHGRLVQLAAVGVPQARPRACSAADLLVRRQDELLGRPPQPAADHPRRRLRGRRLPGPGRPRLGDRDVRHRARRRLHRRRAAVADARHRRRAGRRRRARLRVLDRVPLPTASRRSSTSPGHRDHLSYQTYQGFLSIADGGLTGSGVGRRQRQARLPAARPQRLHLRRHRRRARPRRLGRRRSAGSCCWSWFGDPGRAGRRRPLRHAARRRHHDLVRRAGGDQPRRRHRADAGHRADAAVLLGRRLVAVRVDDGGRAPAQRRPPGRDDDRAGGRRRTVFAVVTGGGTAGHVLPALAIAEALVDRGHEPAEIHYVGAQRGIETRLLPRRRSRTRSSTSSGCSASSTVATCAATPRWCRSSWRRRHGAPRCCAACGPQVVVSVGGYASLPAVLAARRLGVPIVVVSYDRRPGRASVADRLARAPPPPSPSPTRRCRGRRHRRAAAPADPGRRPRPRPGRGPARARPAGGPLRASPSPAARRARRRSTTAVGGVRRRRAADDRAWPCARSSATASSPRRRRHGTARRACSTRSSATTTDIELSTPPPTCSSGAAGPARSPRWRSPGTPAVLVPWSGAAEDHQTLNVRWLADQGGAVLLPEDELDGLGDVIERLRADPPAAADARRAGPGRRRAAPQRGARRPHRARRGRAPGARSVATPVSRTVGASSSLSTVTAVPRSQRLGAARPLRPLRLHVVGVGGPGMSAIAIALAEMGHARVGQRPPRPAGARPGARRRRRRPRRPRPPPSSHGCDAVTSSTAIPATQHRAARRPATWASRRCAGPGCWRRSAPRPGRSASPARTARRPRRRC